MTGDDPNPIIFAAEPAASKKIEDHWCGHPGCRQWGCFGFNGRYGTSWFCRDHRAEGDLIIPRTR